MNKYSVTIAETEEGLSINSNMPAPILLEILQIAQTNVMRDFFKQIDTAFQEQEDSAESVQ